MTPCTRGESKPAPGAVLESGGAKPKRRTRGGAESDELVDIAIGGACGFLLVARCDGVLAGRERAPRCDCGLPLEHQLTHAGARRRCRDRFDLSDEPVHRVVGRVLIAGGAESEVRVQPAPEPAHRVGLRNPADAACGAGTVASSRPLPRVLDRIVTTQAHDGCDGDRDNEGNAEAEDIPPTCAHGFPVYGRYARARFAGGAAWARWPSWSSKPVRSCSPRLGRFDSGAAP